MVIVFCLAFCTVLFSYVEVKGRIAPHVYNLFAIIVVLVLALMLGLRVHVGTDYSAYYRMFSDKKNAEYLIIRGEYIFYIICYFIFSNNLDPHFGFFIIGLIQMFFLMWYLNNLTIRYISLLLVIFFCFSTTFIRSTDEMRSSTAVYIFALGTVYCLHKKYLKALLLFILASFFHLSVILILIVLPILLVMIGKLKGWQLKVLLLMSFVLSLFQIDKYLVEIIKLTPYAMYLNSESFGIKLNIINQITKYIYLPLFFWSIVIFEKKRHNNYYTRLFNLGILAYCFRLIALTTAYGRIFVYFNLFDIIPLHYLISNYVLTDNDNRDLVLFIIVSIIVLPFLAKIIIARGTGADGYDFQFSHLVSLW
jgi:hypothetical protein